MTATARFAAAALTSSAALLSIWLLCCLPFALYALCSSGAPRAGRRLVAGLYLLGVCGAATLGVQLAESLIGHVIAFGYFTIAALFVLWVALPQRRSAAAGWWLFVLFGAVCVVAPGYCFPIEVSAVAVPLGWDLTLRAYSYERDGFEGAQRPCFADALFFLIVNPCLVWPERGHARASSRGLWSGLARCGLGLTALCLHFAIFASYQTWPALQPKGLLELEAVRDVELFLVHYGSRFVAGYAVHSGIASIRIGSLRMLGYDIPERYRYPWLAIDPADFWRRWNHYLGAWARRYLFIPLALRLQRAPLRMTNIGKGTAAVMTFLFIGSFHDFGVFGETHSWPFGGAIVFGLNGIALVAWKLTEGGLRRGAERVLAPIRRIGSLALPALSRLCFLNFLVFTAWLAIPTMSTDLARSGRSVWDWIRTEVAHE